MTGLQESIKAQQTTIVSGESSHAASVVVAGIDETAEESEAAIKKQIQDIFVTEMHVPEEVEVLNVTRLGKPSTDATTPARPRKLLVEGSLRGQEC